MAINASTLAAQMEAVLIVCPPYVCPGTTSLSKIMAGVGCDCSGLPTAIFQAHGLQLYHGSNTIARKYANGLVKLSKVSQLSVGMAVYKWSASGSEPDKYKGDGLGDFHHIGIVCSVNPLRIVHQSSASGCTACDTSIKKWSYCSKLIGVNYNEQAVEPVEESTQEDASMYKVAVTCSSLRIRAQASTSSEILGSLPRGTQVSCAGLVNGWFKLATADGWISAQYVEIVEKADFIPEQEQSTEETSETGNDDIVWLRKRIEVLEVSISELTRRVQALEGDVDHAE